MNSCCMMLDAFLQDLCGISVVMWSSLGQKSASSDKPRVLEKLDRLGMYAFNLHFGLAGS